MHTEVFHDLADAAGIDAAAISGSVFGAESAAGVIYKGTQICKVDAGIGADLLDPLVGLGHQFRRQAVHPGIGSGNGANGAADDLRLRACGLNALHQRPVSGGKAGLIGAAQPIAPR